jgi:argininosuccinate synthase
MRDIEAFLEHSQDRVSGSVEVALHPYRLELLGVTSPYDLMQSGLGHYGETTGGWSGEDVKGFTRILSNPLRIYEAADSNDRGDGELSGRTNDEVSS